MAKNKLKETALSYITTARDKIRNNDTKGGIKDFKDIY